ncbi:recombinase RecA [bacterium]|nr:MAG: recombinase RecA [bacterium]RIK64364.1 MAG: recombinase RecA [Planctomycetota bacterium]
MSKEEKGKVLNIRAEKLKALELAIGGIERNHGSGALMRMSEQSRRQIETISTGSLAVDAALGCGGLPRGRIVEIFGPESSGKTTLALHAIANAQRQGGNAVLIDAEHAFDPAYGRKLGIDMSRLWVSQPDFGEQALDIAEALIASNAVDIIVVDSVAALVPKAELEGEMGDSQMGLLARMMSKAMRKLTAAANKSQTCLVMINQVREKIGVMFGNPETTTGGRALKFFASQRIEVRRTAQIMEGEESIGVGARITVVKNKLAPPFRRCEVEIYFGQGISYMNDLLQFGLQLGILNKSGNWISLGETKLGNGKSNVLEFLRDPANRDLFLKLDAAVRAAVFTPEVEEKVAAA